MRIQIRNTEFSLLPEKALFLHDGEILIVADIHLGKASHFRKEGISMPAGAQQGDYEKLVALLNKTRPAQVYFLGDLFHSSFNKNWHHFEAFIKQFPRIHFTLIKGNHDIIDPELFKEIGVTVEKHFIEDETFVYSHEPLTKIPGNKLNIAGHIHPGIRLSGIAKQNIALPCFIINATTILLPAFGSLTGLRIIPRDNGNEVFAVLPDEVRKL